jgi:hypothetical protein
MKTEKQPDDKDSKLVLVWAVVFIAVILAGLIIQTVFKP